MKKTLTVICAALMLSAPWPVSRSQAHLTGMMAAHRTRATHRMVSHSTKADMTMAAVPPTATRTSAHNRACRFRISSGSVAMWLTRIIVATVTG